MHISGLVVHDVDCNCRLKLRPMRTYWLYYITNYWPSVTCDNVLDVVIWLQNSVIYHGINKVIHVKMENPGKLHVMPYDTCMHSRSNTTGEAGVSF